MAALFNNLLYPLIIMLTIPQALVGGLLAMLIANQPLSIIAMIGVIMLMGLVTKNAILLVDFANTLRARGYRREDALTEAGPTRLRPDPDDDAGADSGRAPDRPRARTRFRIPPGPGHHHHRRPLPVVAPDPPGHPVLVHGLRRHLGVLRADGLAPCRSLQTEVRWAIWTTVTEEDR